MNSDANSIESFLEHYKTWSVSVATSKAQITPVALRKLLKNNAEFRNRFEDLKNQKIMDKYGPDTKLLKKTNREIQQERNKQLINDLMNAHPPLPLGFKTISL